MKRPVFQFPGRSHADIQHDVDDELRFHIESREQELIADGLGAMEARAAALREFGDVDDARRYMRNIDGTIENTRRRRDYFGDFRQDVHYALRSLKSTPSFTVIAILILALGIGANSAVYSVVHGVLQQPLAFPHPDQLVKIWSVNASAGATRAPVSPMDLDDWRAGRSQFADIGGWYYNDGASGMDLTGAGLPQRVSTAFISPGFFSTLQASAAFGRIPREDEMVRGGDDRVVVLSDAYWQRNFGGAHNTVGSTITLDGEPFRVIGVMQKDFVFPSPHTEIFVPYSAIPDHAIPHIRPVRVMEVVGRLKPGVTIEAGRAEMDIVTKRLSAQFPDIDAAWNGASVMSLREAITGPVETALVVLLVAVTFVLLMACANVASLLIARAAAREREMAIRVSVGATGGRILRQLITESVVLSLAGGVAGCAVAAIGTRALIQLSAGQLPRAEEIHVDLSVLVFVLVASLLSGLLSGLAPAIRASSMNLNGMLRGSGRTVTSSSGRLRSALVVLQLAFAVLLAVGAGLMARSFNQLLNVDPGFKPDHLLAVNFSINSARHGDTTWQRYYSDVIERVRNVPGVLSAGAAQYAPFRGMGERNSFVPMGFVARKGEEVPAFPTQRISDGYFHTIGTPILHGREMLPTDRKDSPPVIVVNETYAKLFFPGENAVGKQVTGGGAAVTIVGVVADIRQSAVAEAPVPLIYVSNLQNGRVKVTLVSRTQADPLAMATKIRDAVWSVDRDQPITSIFTFDDVMNETLARPRLVTVLFGAFGTIGMLLAALGIYGVLAFLVTQRRREIGLRIALGANVRGVMMLILRRGMFLAGCGIVAGTIVTLLLARFASTLLYGIKPTDPLTYAAVISSLVGVATLASLVPARRAASVDPLVAMQAE